MATQRPCSHPEPYATVALSPPLLARLAGPLSEAVGCDVHVVAAPRGSDVFVVTTTDPQVVAALRHAEPDALLLVVNDAGTRVEAGDIARLLDEGADAFLNALRLPELAAQVRALLRRRR